MKNAFFLSDPLLPNCIHVGATHGCPGEYWHALVPDDYQGEHLTWSELSSSLKRADGSPFHIFAGVNLTEGE